MCIFCNIIDNHNLAKVVYESEKTIGILDIDPANEGHLLIIPKIHVNSLIDLPDEYVNETIKWTKLIINVFSNIYTATGYSVMQNGGAVCDFGHLHFHVIPRWLNDGYDWVYPVGEKEVSERVANTIKAELDRLVR